MSRTRSTSHNKPIRLGFVPLVDGAPIAVAREHGIFQRHGLDVVLTRELGWTSVREKLVRGQLDAAQSIPGIPITLHRDPNLACCEIAVPMVLNLQGSAITLSNKLARQVIGRGEGLKDFLKYQWKGDRPLILGAPHRLSSQYSLLISWLKRIGIPYPGPVEIVMIPAPLLPRHLKAGLIEGYCVGEPWNSEAIISGSGWSPLRTGDLARYHPENVLAVSGNLIREKSSQLVALIASLVEACEICQSRAARSDLIALLSRREYIGTSPAVLENSLGTTFDSGYDQTCAAQFHIFHGRDTNRPSLDKASWALSELRQSRAYTSDSSISLARIFREDIFAEAMERQSNVGGQ